jgi:hypothetical protein
MDLRLSSAGKLCRQQLFLGSKKAKFIVVRALIQSGSLMLYRCPAVGTLWTDRMRSSRASPEIGIVSGTVLNI